MSEVALVGPKIVCFELAKSGAMIAATAEQTMPYSMGSSAMAAYAIPWGIERRAMLTEARRSAFPSCDV